MVDVSHRSVGPTLHIHPGVRLTVGEVARLVGMSPRNIRAHQARGLLAPPVRQGRRAYYHAGHLRRLEAIKALQRQGFNLVAVQAILGDRDGSAAAGEALRRRLRPRLARPGGDPVDGLLVDLLGQVEPLADDLVRRAGARLAALRLEPDAAPERDRRALAEALVDLLTTSFRAAVERSLVSSWDGAVS